MQYYMIDAFADEVFKGNPAGVCILDEPLAEEKMQKIAFENNLSETAFVYPEGTRYNLRWFTPTFEIDLCGHATLATAYVLSHYIDSKSSVFEFDTASGLLTVTKCDDLYEMSLPLKMPQVMPTTKELNELLGVEAVALYSERDLYVELKSEEEVKSYVPDYAALQTITKWLGVVLTAPGTDCDFVSRYLCPELNMEDPVTGSSHSSLVPLWSKKLGKTELVAKQLSKRGGILYCNLEGDRVIVAGKAVLYLKGEIEVS